jgi:biopolymer transport protein TolR
MAEINVTPFVDVMMVLLIIFMVAAPLLTVGVPVELPKTAASALAAENEEEPLAITVLADGAVQIQTTDTPRGELINRLRGIAAERDSDRIYLRADGAVPYAQVMEIMGALNAAGFTNIGLVTDVGGPALDGSDP